MSTLPLCRCCSFLLLCGSSFDECDNPKVSQHPAMTSRLYSTRAECLDKGSRLWQALRKKSLPQTPTTLRWDKKLHALSPQAIHMHLRLQTERTHNWSNSHPSWSCETNNVSQVPGQPLLWGVWQDAAPPVEWMTNYKRCRNNKVILQNTKTEHTLTHV